MKAIWLIAVNFVREQRWPLLMLIAWVLVSSILSGLGAKSVAIEDVIFFLKTQSVYGVVFVAFLAASGVHNDRKSRRILTVLSKGITRGQYLAGLLTGSLIVTAAYCGAMGLVGGIMFRQLDIPQSGLWAVIALLAAGAAMTATTAMFFSTLMTPLFATAATALAVGSPALAAHFLGHAWRQVLPVYALMDNVLNFSLIGWEPIWGLALWAIADSVVLWALASWVFSLRDITVPVE